MPNVSYFVLGGSNGPQIPNFTTYPTDVYLGRYEVGPTWDETIIGSPTAYVPGNLLIALGHTFSTGGAPGFSDSNINAWTTQQAYPAGGSGLLAFTAVANNNPAIDTFNYNPPGYNAGSFLSILEISSAIGTNFTVAYATSSGGTISVTTASGYNLNVACGANAFIIVFEWGGGVSGQTYRIAYLSPAREFTTFPSGWTLQSSAWFPTLNIGPFTDNFEGFYEFTDIPCNLVVNPSTLNFAAPTGGPNPPAQLVTVTSNAGAEAFTFTSSQPWLTPSSGSGTTPTSVSIAVNVAGLANGTYTGVVTFSSGCGTFVLNVNLLVTTPCVVTDLAGNLISTYVPDLQLNVTPATALYNTFVPRGNIALSEYKQQGRADLIFDFNSGDGIYSKDIGTIFSWSLTNRLVLGIWQPSLIPMPEAIYNRPGDWDDGGYSGAKFIQGVIVEADSFNVAKTFSLQSSDDLSVNALFETPAVFQKQRVRAFSCNPFVAHNVRLLSTDGVAWRVWQSKLVFEPWPELVNNWQSEMTSLGIKGWAHARECNIAYASNAIVSVLFSFDAWPQIILTLPSTAGVQAKTKVTLPANKWKLMSMRVFSASPFYLFEGDLELKVKEWGSTGAYTVLKIVGGKSKPGADV